MFKREEGQALVEVGVSLGILVIMMLGAVEFGRIAYASIEINNAAKAAAQYGAQSHATALDQAGMLAAAQNEFVNPSGVSLTSPSGTTGYACNCADTGNSVSCTNNSVTTPVCSGSYAVITITVQAQTSFDPLIHIPGLPKTFTLVGVSKQKVLQ